MPKKSAYIAPPFNDPVAMQKAIIGNALRVYNGGSRALGAAGKKIGETYAQTIQAGYSSPGTKSRHPGGKKYWDSELKRYTRASRPGDPPALQTGKLMDSVRWSSSRVPVKGPGGKMMKGFGKTVIQVFSTLEHAASLEKGTSTIAMRPLWMPTRNNPKVWRMIQIWTVRWFIQGERAEAVKLRSGNYGAQMGKQVLRGGG